MHQIETQRLTLTPYRPEDVGDLHALWCSPGVRRYLFDNELIPVEFVQEEIKSNEQQFATHGWGQWKARFENEEKTMGFCGFREFHDPPVLELLFGLDESYWGRGLAGEMARAMIGLGFLKWGFKRIQGSTDAPNTASIRVMEKLGMTLFKREDSHGLDTVYFEILPEAFHSSDLSLKLDGEPIHFSHR